MHLHANGIEKNLNHVEIAIRSYAIHFFLTLFKQGLHIADLDLKLVRRLLGLSRSGDLGQVNLEKLVIVADAIFESLTATLGSRVFRQWCFCIDADSEVKHLFGGKDVHVGYSALGHHAFRLGLDDLVAGVGFVWMDLCDAHLGIFISVRRRVEVIGLSCVAVFYRAAAVGGGRLLFDAVVEQLVEVGMLLPTHVAVEACKVWVGEDYANVPELSRNSSNQAKSLLHSVATGKSSRTFWLRT